jgi:predicted enzyme related to lactoylglutathione lyase
MTRAASSPVVHLELHTGELERACEFYAAVCGWRPAEVRAAGLRYRALDAGRGVGAGVVECPTEHSLWLPYVGVRDVRRATERARELGATALLEPREGPAGWRSVVASPAAGELAFWEPK